METEGGKAILKFDHVGTKTGLDTFDVRQPIGFTIAGQDKKFVEASAKIVSITATPEWIRCSLNRRSQNLSWSV